MCAALLAEKTRAETDLTGIRARLDDLAGEKERIPSLYREKTVRDFLKLGLDKFDAKGRSLRQFDLKTRLFRTPLSYVVYSRHFDGLPPEAKAQVYRRLWEVLTGKDQTKPFAHLSAADRLAALEILRATKPGLPAYWK